MSATASTVIDRVNYVEQSLVGTIDDLRHPIIRNALGSHADKFGQMLQTAAVLDVNDGYVDLPDDYDYEHEPVPVVGLFPGEAVLFGDEFFEQAQAQRNKTLEVFKSWAPQAATAHVIYDEFIAANSGASSEPFILPSLSRAMTITAGPVLSAARLSRYFSASPAKGLSIFRNRPLIMLEVLPDRECAPADDVVHELAHYRRAVAHAAISVHSQRSVNMAMLREELEAYHYGTPVSLVRFEERKKRRLTDRDIGELTVQMGVEAIRRQNELNPEDPFMPSGHLLNQITTEGYGNIMHAVIDYEDMARKVALYDLMHQTTP